MNRLVIAEKPSVGKAIAAVLGAHGREDGCFIGNGYIVSWCFGHLAELAAADTYDEKYGKWRCEDLPTLNVGRVVSPTLALIVQREAEIKAFTPVPFYTVNLTANGFEAASERFSEKAGAEGLQKVCKGASATVTGVERKEKTEKAPALYDLTTLQRDANRLLGYTAQQTLDYLQALYEKKLCTYPRTNSRFLTDDMQDKVSELAAIAAEIAGKPLGEVNASQVCNSKKVSDHHAVVPTMTAGSADLSALPAGERAVLGLIAQQVLCAVGSPHIYAETAVTLGYSSSLVSVSHSRSSSLLKWSASSAR